MKNLRSYIRRILQEAMVSPNSLVGEFAVWSDWYPDSGELPPGTEINFMLYNKRKALEDLIAIQKDPDTQDLESYEVIGAIEGETMAAIRARVPDAGYGQCNSAWEIIRSAAEKGYGPTLYDLVMSVAPNGLTSDRSEVSSSARGVWSKYANARGDVDKRLLDPDGRYTYNDEDDCTVDGYGSLWDRTPLPKLHRQMAIDFLEDYYPLEYEEFLEDQDPARIEDLVYADGDEYWDEVRSWIEDNAEDNDYDEWDEEQANDEWFDWKMGAEPDLADNIEGEIEEPAQLGFSYNTDYAEDTMVDLINNHWSFQSELEDLINGTLGIDGDAVNFAVRDFFNEKYRN